MIVPIVLSGGAGTRLWPLSTERLAKQFLRIWDGERSLFQESILRVSGQAFAPPAVICNASQEHMARSHATEVGVALSAMLLEPLRRDSAAAIAAAAAWAEATHGRDAVVAMFPSDHVIPDDGAFRQAITRAAAIASDGHLAVLGIQPTYAATEFGYIEQGRNLVGHDGAFHVARFHEKPDRDTASAYIRSARFHWNAGILVFAARSFGEEADRLMPDIHSAARDAVAKSHRRGGIVALDEPAFARARKTSIDYALLEKTDRAAVLPVSFAWSDVGNWAALRKALGPNDDGNVAWGDVTLDAGAGNLVIASDLPVRVTGLDDVAVIASPDGVLVTRLGQR